MPGFPIRTPSDHSSVDSSPRTIAASHVLHRLLMPRHPPCALTHLTTTRCSHPLCNTQHTTTPRNQEPTTPTPRPRQSNTQHHSTEHQGCVREPRPGADQKKQPQPPQRRPECLLRTQQCAEPPRKNPGKAIESAENVPPSHTTHPTPKPGAGALFTVRNQMKGEPTLNTRTHSPHTRPGHLTTR